MRIFLSRFGRLEAFIEADCEDSSRNPIFCKTLSTEKNIKLQKLQQQK